MVGTGGSHCILICATLYLAPVVCALEVPIWFDSSNGWHRSIGYHPEQPARIDACVKAMQKLDGAKLVDTTPDPSTLWKDTDHQHDPFSKEELDHARDVLLKTHDEDLVLTLEGSCQKSRQLRIEEGRDPLGFIGNIDDDTYLTTLSFDVCLRATAAWIRAVDFALKKNRPAFALTRPPGHHATLKLSNGFCLLNFAAAAAIHALESNPNIKVSIFDWDVHYGQGVSKIIQKFDRARYVSIHQSPAFPYLGTKFEIGGECSNIMTIPIPAETTWTCGYREKFEDYVLPFVCSDDDSWNPDLVLVCAGYDALDSDELASVSLQSADYQNMTSKLISYLQKQRQMSSVVFGLEGGYQLSEMAGGGNLADAAARTVQALIEAKLQNSK